MSYIFFEQNKLIAVQHELICRYIITGFRSLPILAVMESAADAKYFSDLDEDYSKAEVSFGHFLDGDAREDGRFFGHDPYCNAAAGCNCSFARLNCSEITVLAQTIQTLYPFRLDGLEQPSYPSHSSSKSKYQHRKNISLQSFLSSLVLLQLQPTLPSPRQASGS
jgi:hypothetical protein